MIRRAVIAGAVPLALAALSSCSQLKDNLLTADDPDVIKPSTISTPEAADALRIGALGRFRNINAGGESAWMLGGLMTDEWKSSDTFLQRNETDQRTIQDNNANIQGMLREIYRVRTNSREAIDALLKYKPQPASGIAQMYFTIGFAEMTLAENFCNGIPLGDASSGTPEYGPPHTDAEVFAIAIAHFDTALANATATDTVAVSIRNASTIAKARVLVDLGQWSQAATLVSGIATNFQWRSTFSLTNGQNNGIWNLSTSQKRWTVGDSFDVGGLIPNALPFASAKDPRIPTTGNSSASNTSKGFDTSTPFVVQTIWGRTDPTPVVTGLDARLIEAETKLRANDVAGMMTILNQLRAAPQNLGILNTPVMAALATPAAGDAAIDLFFREKAFWTFSRGQRLSDQRRLIRQYGRTQDRVFPSGSFFKGGSYGTDVNIPITTDELNNPDFKGCMDRNA
jgi:hypothetical protein